MKKILFLFIIYSINLYSQTGSDLVDISIQNTNISKDLVELAIEFDHEKKWHTYWKNPGDSGLPIEFQYQVDGAAVNHVELEWPTPKRHIEDGDIWTYGYEGKVHFFHQLKKEDLINGKEITLKMKWLICKDICIPGEKTISAKISDSNPAWSEADLLNLSDQKIEELKANLPVETNSDFEFSLEKSGEKELKLSFFSLKNKRKEGTPYLIPFPSPLVIFLHPKFSDDNSGSITLEWTGHYNEPEVQFPEDGNFKDPFELAFLISDGSRSKIIKKSFRNFSSTPPSASDKVEKPTVTTQAPQSTTLSLWYVLLFAFLGGLILNFMPCVLPVISIKLFGLIKYKDASRKKIIRHNSLYSLGVFSTLFSLGGIIVLLKNSGEKIGWGFQLQNPYFLLIMVFILFIMTLNFFGLFEFGTPGGKSLANKQIDDSPMGDFFSGVLATILSTPCSAPFLGTALTFALTTSNTNIFLTFAFIALGLCFPFILTMIFPGSLKVLPKPGIWMEKFKYFLGFSLLLTTIWLADVFISIIGAEFIFVDLLIFLAVSFFAIFSYQKMSKNILLTIVFIVSTLFFGNKVLKGIQKSTETPTTSSITNSNWSRWQPDTIKQAIENNETIFIDFTAKWCLTCQVNKKAVLHTDSFYEVAKKHKIKLYQADWTKKDKNITSFLEEQGLVGIPAYFLVKDGQLHSLGEVITTQKLESFF